jgi:hypothetical protein
MLNDILSQFNSPVTFNCHPGSFKETVRVWKRDRLFNNMNTFRQYNNIQRKDFLVFLTKARDEFNWFSACSKQWDNNFFINTSDWDIFINTNRSEYPIAYEIVENLIQYLMSNNYEEYKAISAHETKGCINDLCQNKKDIMFKLRTADICDDCMKIIKNRIDDSIIDQFIEILENIRFQFLHSKRNFTIFQKSITQGKIRALTDLREEFNKILASNKNEAWIQRWIDKDNGKFRSLRCLIFGIEYVNPKREGELIHRRRFDILAEQNLDNYIIIELKSPLAEIFNIKESLNSNEGVNLNYKLSSELSKAIPQIIKYKEYYNQADFETIKNLGLSEKKNISECIIVIGRRKKDEVWKKHFQNLIENIKIKIYTYDDLIDKMDNTIKNLDKLI